VVIRILVATWLAWTVSTAPVAAEPNPDAGSSPAPGGTPNEPAPTRDGAGERLSDEDDELIKNLDLIESLDLLDSVEVFGALNPPATAEEEF
jgi:hypothetical protein